MTTLLEFIQLDSPFSKRFALLNGDLSHLDGVYLNAGEDLERENEAGELIFDENGEFKLLFSDTPSKNYDKFITIGTEL